MRRYELEKIAVEDIHIGDRLRRVDQERVAALAASINDLGLQTPLSVRVVKEMEIAGETVAEVPVLIAGATRLAAVKSLGWEKVECFILDADDIDARLWEIAENLHRAELTALERDQHIAEWVRLTEEKAKAQDAPSRPGGRPDRGINKASRELGIERTQVQRAVKVASLAPEAKEAAKEVGLDDNQSALLSAAKHSSKEAQIAALRQKAAERAERKAREHGEVKDTKADAREILAQRIADNISGEDLADVTTALAILGQKEVVARIQTLTGAVFDNTRAGAAA